MKVDFRLISATNSNLLELVKAGHFREDLFYRLHIFPITMPPLRERLEDVPDLVRRFVTRFAAEEGKRVRSVSAEAIKMLTSYRWPGNVRQLENAVFRAVVLADTDEIGVAEFPQIAAQVPGFEAFAAPQPLPAPRPAHESASAPLVIDAPETAPAAWTDSLPLLGADGHMRLDGGDRGIRHPLRHWPLSRPHDRGFPPARDWPLDALSQAEGFGPCRPARTAKPPKCRKLAWRGSDTYLEE